MPATATIVELREAAAPTPQPPQPAPDPASIEGRIDAVQNGRIYGWAWDRAHPGDRLAVEIRLDGQGGTPPLGVCVADLPREDLTGGGIGDGGHAFEAEIALPPEVDPARVVAVVRSPGAGTVQVLVQPSAEEKLLDRTLAPHLLRIAGALDALRRDHRQFAGSHQALGRMMRELQEGNAALRNDGGPADRHAALCEALDAVTERVGALEVFLMRMDTTLRGFDGALSSRAAQSGHPWAVALLGASGGAFLATLAGFALFR